MEEKQKRIYWNRNWQFLKGFEESYLGLQAIGKVQEVEQAELPHTVQEVPLHYFDESLYQGIFTYRKVFRPDADWQGKRVLLMIEAAGHSAWVYLNGELLNEHHCGYTAFQTDLSPALIYEKENVLVVKVDSTESQNIPPFGKVIDYMTFGGLYREVYLEVKEQDSIADVYAMTIPVWKEVVSPDSTGLGKQGGKKAEHLEEISGSGVKCKEASLGKKWKLQSEITLQLHGEKITLNAKNLPDFQEKLSKKGLMIRQTLLWTKEEEASSSAYLLDRNVLEHTFEEINVWDVEHPFLYTLRTELYRDGACLDSVETRIGFREVVFRRDGFYLNGRKLKLRGLNRHQSYPYVGYAMPESMQKWDADILKNELKLNAVRTSHYPQSHHFLDRCDELGLLVFTEIPGWQYIGGPEWQDQAVRNTEDMVVQYRNHPSIILWGVRINESEDDDAFYQRTNEAAHRLDPMRQTSGVRYLQKSSLLEDVYAFNDFSHEGNNRGCRKKKDVTPDTSKGYLISEYNGHMFPTKSFDCEQHRVEHLLRHANVLDAYYGEEEIAGGFGWCMFDYNTHKDFGSGDRVCYHGVLDLFRNPKLAAALYASQGEEDVLEITSSMDIGEYPACLIRDVYAVTNADSVKLYKNDRFVKEFRAADSHYTHLPHGPIAIDDFIGELLQNGENFSKGKAKDVKKVLQSVSKNGLNHLPLGTILLAAKCMLLRGMKMADAVELYNKYIGNWGGTATEYRFEAIRDGKVVKTVKKRPVNKPQLLVDCSHTILTEKTTYDVAAIRLRAVSEEGSTLSYCNEPLTLTVKGPLSIIGPSTISLQGGMGGTYVRTCGIAGSAELTMAGSLFGEHTVKFEVVCAGQMDAES